jgi:hypothetical protein
MRMLELLRVHDLMARLGLKKMISGEEWRALRLETREDGGWAMPHGGSAPEGRLMGALLRLAEKRGAPPPVSSQVLFRVFPGGENREEWEEVRKFRPSHFHATPLRRELREGAVILPRYSLAPHYQELELEVLHAEATLFQPASVWRALAEEMAWVTPLMDLTPRTWTSSGWATVPDAEHGWVVKGKNNSRKTRWNTHMRAPDRQALKDVMYRLMDDPVMADQGLVIREYVPLAEVAPPGVNGLPVTDEWRFHFLDGDVIGAGFYWTNQDDYAPPSLNPPMGATRIAQDAAHRLLPLGMKWVSIDVARRRPGTFQEDELEWIVVEVNSGEQSGLQGCDPYEYYNLLTRLSALSAHKSRGLLG